VVLMKIFRAGFDAACTKNRFGRCDNNSKELLKTR
jgi:hypothetical protein